MGLLTEIGSLRCSTTPRKWTAPIRLALGDGVLKVKRQKVLEDVFVRDVFWPTVGREDRRVEPGAGVR